MQFTFITHVNAPIDHVAKNFNQELLEKLKPPGVSMELLRYDGQFAGNQLSFKIGIGPFKQQWDGIITAHRYTQAHWLFRDEGLRLPKPLKNWKHTHALKSIDSKTTAVIDRIKFEGNSKLSTLFLVIPMIMMFFMRKPGYKKHLHLR